jgi:hypothetical protein
MTEQEQAEFCEPIRLTMKDFKDSRTKRKAEPASFFACKPGKGWSANCDPSAETWLQNCAKKHCESGLLMPLPSSLSFHLKKKSAGLRALVDSRRSFWLQLPLL